MMDLADNNSNSRILQYFWPVKTRNEIIEMHNSYNEHLHEKK
jgi:hypothetical protein